MARYGCLALGVILALLILFTVVFLWSGWLNRPVGHSPPPAVVAAEPGGLQWSGPLGHSKPGLYLLIPASGGISIAR